jgi:CheY-like chemotaxis protein
VRDPFVAAVARALPRKRPAEAAEYLALLERRLRFLRARAAGDLRQARRVLPRRGEAALGRRFLRRLGENWDDGDENLVREKLDRLGRGSGDPGRDAASSLVEAADELGVILARPGTLFFYLWELESMLTSPGDIAMIPAVPREAHAARRALMAKRILVVDDDENILNLEKTILEQKGFDVTGAGGGAEALKLLGEKSFDLVLLDVMMPEVDGFTVCRKIKEDPKLKDIPVIFLTAKGGGEALAEGFESGAVMYINKPFTANKLLTIVNTMLESGTNLS